MHQSSKLYGLAIAVFDKMVETGYYRPVRHARLISMCSSLSAALSGTMRRTWRTYSSSSLLAVMWSFKPNLHLIDLHPASEPQTSPLMRLEAILFSMIASVAVASAAAVTTAQSSCPCKICPQYGQNGKKLACDPPTSTTTTKKPAANTTKK